MLVTARVLEAGHPVILSDDLLISCLCLRVNRIIKKIRLLAMYRLCIATGHISFTHHQIAAAGDSAIFQILYIIYRKPRRHHHTVGDSNRSGSDCMISGVISYLRQGQEVLHSELAFPWQVHEHSLWWLQGIIIIRLDELDHDLRRARYCSMRGTFRHLRTCMQVTTLLVAWFHRLRLGHRVI